MPVADRTLTPLPGRVVARMFLRSFAIQGSWNYRTLQGSGFAYALMPVLRHVYAHDDERLQDAVLRHTSLFNAHPYLAGVALGAVARMEADGDDPAIIERFKIALRGSLGSLGDRIVWAGWRPACVLLAIDVLLATESALTAILVFLLVYNAGHLALRWWCLRIGVDHGKRVGEQLRRAPLLAWHERVVDAITVFLGFALPLAAVGSLTNAHLPATWVALPAAAAVAGYFAADRSRLAAIILLVIVAIAGLLFPLTQ
jgi:mannose PTS system EIID component